MKKSQEISRKTRRMIAKNLIVMIVLVVATVVGVHSWFSSSTSASASGISLSAKVSEGLEIQIVAPGAQISQNKWVANEVTLDAANYPFLSTLNLLPVTGDGKVFIQPPITQVSAVATVNNGNVTWDASKIKTKANTEYVSFDVYFRTRSAGKKVYLGDDTYYGPLDSTESFGNSLAGWSSNSVIGACRMSVLDSSNNQDLLWIPAPHLYYDGITLDTNVTDTSNTLGLNYVDANNQKITLHSDGTYNHGYYISKNNRNTISYGDQVKSNVTANTNMDFMLHKNVDMANLTDTSVQQGYYMNHVRVNLWIEGEDPESRATQVGGEFKVVLNFEMVAAS